MDRSLDEVETYHQLLKYAEDEFHKSNLEGREYWQGVKDGIRRAGVILGVMSKRDCEEIRNSSNCRPYLDEIIGKNKI